jgi:hypothetical protein
VKTSRERAREIAEKHAHHGHSKGTLCEDCTLMADDIAAAIDEAVGAEREINARIADALKLGTEENHTPNAKYPITHYYEADIAGDIRAREKVGAK